MKFNDTRAVLESGMLTALIMVFSVIGMTVPLLGFLATIVAPLTLIVLAVRRGFQWSVLAVITSTIGISLIVGPMQAFVEGGTFGLLGLVVAYGYVKRWSYSKLLIWPTAYLFLAIVGQFFLSSYLLHLDVASMWATMQAETMQTMTNAYQQQGYTEEQITQAMTVVKEQMNLFADILIGSMFAGLLGFVYILCVFTNKVLSRLGLTGVYMPGIAEWRMPYWTLYLFFGSLMVAFGIKHVEWLRQIGTNGAYFGGILLFLQGASYAWRLVSAYTEKRFVKWLVMALLAWASISGVVLGIYDLMSGHRRQQTQDSGQE